MGLDMYLTRVSKNGNRQPVMYWEKANQIHNRILRYFNADTDYNANDSPLVLDKCAAYTLLLDLKTVINSPERAKEILPTLEGFCFGDIEYDEYYYQQIKDTYSELSVIAEETDRENERLEYSCWW